MSSQPAHTPTSQERPVAQIPSHRYRPEIDGLRGVVVSLVVVYHAFPTALPGGFIGVDVFFVISGFLITSIILSDLQQGTFRISDFYARRIRRIFPALALVLVSSLIAGWFLLFADEFHPLGRHAAAGASFLSNIQLLREAGYFDRAADTKPLLHLWSLGIEEQFYIVYPLALYLIFRLRLPFRAILSGFAAVSFVGCIAVTMLQESVAFYFPATRFWELLLGGLIASKPSTRIPPSSRFASVWSCAGLFLIISTAFVYSRDTTFPGFAAAIPTVGALLVILGHEESLACRLLAHRVLVWLGLISYPLYLWHWPLLTFGRISGYAMPYQITLLVAASLFAAVLTYQLVERPIRFGKHISTITLVSGMCVAGALGFTVDFFDGFPARPINFTLNHLAKVPPPSPTTLAYRPCPDNVLGTSETSAKLSYCKISRAEPPEFALVGDSHAEDKFRGIATGNPERSWLLIGKHSCPPVLDVNVEFPGEPNCLKVSTKTLQYLAQTPTIKTVVLAFWSNYMLPLDFAGDHKEHHYGPDHYSISSTKFAEQDKKVLFRLGLESTLHMLRESGKNVVVIVDPPELPFTIAACRRGALDTTRCTAPRALIDQRQSAIREIIRQLRVQFPSVRFFDSTNLFCNHDRCSALVEGVEAYRDSNHLNDAGSSYFGRIFVGWLNRAGI